LTVILSGLIGPFTIADVFQFLANAQCTGQLVIDTGDDRALVYFHTGELIYARRKGPTERLGERLLRLGIISESQLLGANLRAEMNKHNRRIGQIFIEAGSLDRSTLQKVVRDQIREVVNQVLAFTRGEFQFHADRLPEGEDILLDIPLELLLIEGLTRLDEIAQDLTKESGPPDPA
jgi:hypothetical protein